MVDDQSRDGSLALLRQLEALHFDEGLRVLALPENGGVCRARNQALRRASYRHVLVMDRDPGRVALDLEVALPRPRPIAVRDEPAFAAHTAKVRAAMPRAGASRAA